MLYRKDVAAGLMFVATGTSFCAAASMHRMGTVTDMGPGYFPFWVGAILAVLGAVVFLGGLRAAGSADDLIGRWDWKALAIVVASMVLFGLLLQPLGLIVAVVVLVLVASAASHDFTWGMMIVTALVLIALSVTIFVWGIGLPLPVWPAVLVD